MNILPLISSVGWFIVFISIIVFIHEFGHYIMARRFGVKVETFSIGFGQTLWSTVDRAGTCWKIGILPFGGYVQMYGDKDPAGEIDYEEINKMTAQQYQQSFFSKSLWQKALIVVGGPAANYLLALVILTFLFYLNGIQSVAPIISAVTPNSPAQQAGLASGDKILAVDKEEIITFQDVRKKLSTNLGDPVLLTIERQGENFEITLTPELKELKTLTGDIIKQPVIGVSANVIEHQRLNVFMAFYHAIAECYHLSETALITIWQMLTGARGTQELSGPIKIAQYSGVFAKAGFEGSLWFIAIISLNLGLINLLPIPLLDGGHLAFYLVEGLRGGKPLPPKLHAALMRVGGMILVFLIIFALGNDIASIFN
jgi:regulator of sigma E protease